MALLDKAELDNWFLCSLIQKDRLYREAHKHHSFS